jgi:hypothetical protein
MGKKSNAADRQLAYRCHATGVLQTFLKGLLGVPAARENPRGWLVVHFYNGPSF